MKDARGWVGSPSSPLHLHRPEVEISPEAQNDIRKANKQHKITIEKERKLRYFLAEDYFLSDDRFFK